MVPIHPRECPHADAPWSRFWPSDGFLSAPCLSRGCPEGAVDTPSGRLGTRQVDADVVRARVASCRGAEVIARSTRVREPLVITVRVCGHMRGAVAAAQRRTEDAQASCRVLVLVRDLAPSRPP